MIPTLVDKIADKVRWGYLGAFIILLGSYILTFSSTQTLLRKAEMVNHTNIVIYNLDNLLSEMKDAESSFRGYLVIHDEKFLDGFYKAPAAISSSVEKLRNLVSDNPVQGKRLDSLELLINKKYGLLTHGLALFRENNFTVTDSMRRMAFYGKQLMDDITNATRGMQRQEEVLVTERSEEVFAKSRTIKIVNIVSLVIAILLAFYSILTFNKENKARQNADLNAAQFREELEMRIKELNRLNSELVELKSIEKFAVTGRISRTIAHEVRNPLTNINLAAEHLRSELPANDETNLLLDMVTRNSNRINQLISDLLNSTKATVLNFESVNINDLLDASLVFAKDRIELNGVSVMKNYGQGIPDISVDKEKIKIAFLNIIVNAIEAMPHDKGILEITTANRNGKCVVEIKDNGRGMTNEELSRLFEPYFTTKENGTGLGLTNTQNIILSHKAAISAESEPGRGTKFTISFLFG